MRKKWKTSHSGYLLIESIFSLIVLGSAIISVCATYLYLKQQENQAREELTAYQFLYENALYQQKEPYQKPLEKRSDKWQLQGITSNTKPQQKVKILIGKKEYEIAILSRSFAEK